MDYQEQPMGVIHALVFKTRIKRVAFYSRSVLQPKSTPNCNKCG
jgi:hypothetical protein